MTLRLSCLKSFHWFMRPSGCIPISKRLTSRKATVSKSLIIPSQIPWKSLKNKELEELLYWLFDSMGAKNLQWRIGGSGDGAADGGRDIECTFYLSAPDGNLVQQRWWIEAKGRSGTVEPTAVKEAIINATDKRTVDVLVIATNSGFSNPTRDWVREWQEEHVRPHVKLWESSDLEKHCSKNPLAVIRLFGKALSPQGQLEVLKTKLWDYSIFTDVPTLVALWQMRDQFSIDERALVALCASELANGNIASRSWAAAVGTEIVIKALGEGLVNYPYLLNRANESGTRYGPIRSVLSYLVLISCARNGSDKTAAWLESVWKCVEGPEYPDEIIRRILKTVLDTLNDELYDVCTSDCRRISTKPIILTESDIEHYWQRLEVMATAEEKDSCNLIIESMDETCKVGFPVDNDSHCPLFQDNDLSANLRQTLEMIEKVISFRKDNHDI